MRTLSLVLLILTLAGKESRTIRDGHSTSSSLAMAEEVCVFPVPAGDLEFLSQFSAHPQPCPGAAAQSPPAGAFGAGLGWISQPQQLPGSFGSVMERWVFLSCSWLGSLPVPFPPQLCPKENNGSHWMLCPIFSPLSSCNILLIKQLPAKHGLFPPNTF